MALAPQRFAVCDDLVAVQPGRVRVPSSRPGAACSVADRPNSGPGRFDARIQPAMMRQSSSSRRPSRIINPAATLHRVRFRCPSSRSVPDAAQLVAAAGGFQWRRNQGQDLGSTGRRYGVKSALPPVCMVRCRSAITGLGVSGCSEQAALRESAGCVGNGQRHLYCRLGAEADTGTVGTVWLRTRVWACWVLHPNGVASDEPGAGPGISSIRRSPRAAQLFPSAAGDDVPAPNEFPSSSGSNACAVPSTVFRSG